MGCNLRYRRWAYQSVKFQYPLRVEVGCKPPRKSPRCSLTSFSTLYGSKWVANFDNAEHAQTWKVSVPSTGRSGLQDTTMGRKPSAKVVSVPSTGRSGLQPEFLFGNDGSINGFSTLYGSKWVATRSLRTWSAPALRFQYPLRVEVGCNTNGTPRMGDREQVSVPSTGRSGLQFDKYEVDLDRLEVSVPSTGRSGLQVEVAQTRFRATRFQYPLRVEVGCNLLDRQGQ